jgi:hypothetical protein
VVAFGGDQPAAGTNVMGRVQVGDFHGVRFVATTAPMVPIGGAAAAEKKF